MRAVNLLPPEERSRVAIAPGRTGGIVYAIFGLLAGLAILAFMYGSASHQISSDKTEIVSLTARTQAAQARASALTPYTSFAALREQRERTVEELVNSRFDWASAFHELGRVLPSSVSLTSLTGQVGTSANGSASSSSSSKSSSSSSSSSASSATPPGSVPTFTIAGCATSQEQVAVMLDRLRLIQGVSEVALQSSTKGGPSGAGSGAASGSGGCEPANPAFNVTVTFEALPTLPTSGPTTSTVASTGGSSTSESSTGGSSTSGNSGGGGSSSSGNNNNSSNGPGESVDGVSSNRASSAVETAR